MWQVMSPVRRLFHDQLVEKEKNHTLCTWSEFEITWTHFFAVEKFGAHELPHIRKKTVKYFCQSFRGTIYKNGENIPKRHKIYQVAGKLTQGHKIFYHLPLREPLTSTQIWIFACNGHRYSFWSGSSWVRVAPGNKVLGAYLLQTRCLWLKIGL
jgi:hypothetical protein